MELISLPPDTQSLSIVTTPVSQQHYGLNISSTTNSAGTDATSEWKIVLFSLFLFLAAGLCEIGGGYLVWKGMKDQGNQPRKSLFIALGSLILVIYGVIPTFQPSTVFGRVYAVYGGFFIVLSYCWSAVFDQFKPDLGDYIGSAVALCGVCMAWFWPRSQ